MCRRFVLAVCIILLFAAPSLAGRIIHVPADQPTIQDGINVASNGDAVLVAPGTYTENINFNGKAITVESSKGASVTTIANSGGGATVTFNQSEMPSSVLKGFTLQGGVNTVGIVIGSSPTILNNVITGNHSCDGAGINISWASPIIEGNTITGNFHDQCSGGGGGGGIAVGGQGSAQIIGNTISGNDGGNGFAGGGISLFAAGSPVIINNVIMNNSIQTQGGGIGIGGCCSDAIIVQNLIIGNTAPTSGGGIYSFSNSGAPKIVNNTLVRNQSSGGVGSGIYTNSSPNNPTQIYNNIIFGVSGETAIYCDNFNTTTLPVPVSNDVYAPRGKRYGGICKDPTGKNGNISADPRFVSSSNLRVKDGSPVIDAGDNTAPNLPNKDFVGNPRIIDGKGLSTPIVDMGAYEFVPVQAVTYQINTQHTGSIITPGLLPPLVVKWSVDLRANVSYPLIVGGKVYVVTGAKGASEIHLLALDARTGSTVWGPIAIPVLYSDWAGLAYDNGMIFLVPGTTSITAGTMYAFDVTDGHQIWNTALPGETSFSSPPTAYNGIVYTGGAGVGGYVYGVRESDGAVLWEDAVENGDNSSPAVDASGVYVSYACPQTYKFDLVTGFYIWHSSGGCEGGGGSTPVLYRSLLYVRELYLNNNYNAEVFNSSNGAVVSYFNSHFAPVFWKDTAFYSQPTAITAVNLTSGNTVWSAAPPSGDSYSISPIVVNGTLYIGTQLGTLLGYDSSTGVQVESIPMGAPITGDDLAIPETPLAGLGAAEGLLVVPASSRLVALGPH
jgi:hypothetical protein